MTTVSNVLRVKGSTLWTVGPEATVFQALQLMADKNIGAVLVLQGGRLAGIFSERDYARKVILRGRSSRETTVGELMTAQVVTVTPDDSIEACMELMVARRFRHLPVVDAEDGRLLGMVSIGDIGKAIIADQKVLLRSMENYITGVPG